MLTEHFFFVRIWFRGKIFFMQYPFSHFSFSELINLAHMYNHWKRMNIINLQVLWRRKIKPMLHMTTINSGGVCIIITILWRRTQITHTKPGINHVWWYDQLARIILQLETLSLRSVTYQRQKKSLTFKLAASVFPNSINLLVRVASHMCTIFTWNI